MTSKIVCHWPASYWLLVAIKESGRHFAPLGPPPALSLEGPTASKHNSICPPPSFPFFPFFTNTRFPTHIYLHTHMFLPGCPRSTAFHFPSKQEAIVPKFGPLSITFHILLCFRLTIYPSFFHQKIMSLVIFR